MIVHDGDRLKKRTKPEVIWFFSTPGHGQMEWADKCLKIYNTMIKVTNYYLRLTGDKIIVYNNLHTNEMYLDLFQMFTDNHLQLKEKYVFYNFFPEKLCVISVYILRNGVTDINHILTIAVNC
jgi:hypothetical protein